MPTTNNAAAPPGDPTPLDGLFADAAYLDRRGVETGNEQYRRAAGVLRGRHAGRPRKYGDDVFAAMAHMIETGKARNNSDAAAAFAMTLPRGEATEKTVTYLRINYARWRKGQINVES